VSPALAPSLKRRELEKTYAQTRLVLAWRDSISLCLHGWGLRRYRQLGIIVPKRGRGWTIDLVGPVAHWESTGVQPALSKLDHVGLVSLATLEPP
jgi:hypothetical protein